MDTYRYLNCYAMLETVRVELNDYSEDLVQGTANGVYNNADIVRKLNQSQRHLFNLLFMRLPELFLTSSSVSGSSGVYIIPSDCYRLQHIVTSNGDKIHSIDIKVKHLANSTGSDNLYYRSGNTIIIDSGDSSALTFHYYKEPLNLTQGCSVGGTSTTITLASSAMGVADYYNNVVIENASDNWYATISDYTAARVATIARQGTAGRYYGTVSELPEAFHPLIVRKAVLTLKNYVTSPQRATIADIGDYRDELTETLRAVCGSNHGDISPADLFYNFEPYA